MQKGVPIIIERHSYGNWNGFRVGAATTADGPDMFFSTKKSLLSAIDNHFVEARKPKTINLVDEANRILAGSTPVAEEAI
jgi:hypothetical protein